MSQLISLFAGAVLGYCSGWLKWYVDERRKRRAVATALLVEQHRLNETLAYIRDRWRGGRGVAAFSSSVHDRFASDVVLFDPMTVARVLDFSLMLAEVRRAIEYATTSVNEGEKKRYVGEAKYLCGTAIAKAELARESLVARGGILLQEHPLMLSPKEEDTMEEIENA